MDSTNLRTDIHRVLEVESIVVHRRLMEVEIPWLSIAEFVGGGVQGRWWRWWRLYLDLSTHNTGKGGSWHFIKWTVWENIC